MTDFTVRVNKLPKVREYYALDLLKAALTLHIEKIIRNQAELDPAPRNDGHQP